MLYKWKELIEKEGSRFLAETAIAKHKYDKVAHGVYSDDGIYLSELEQLFVMYPKATLSLQSAFEYYGLSNYIPDKYYLVTPYNAHTINNPKVTQQYMSEDIINIGRTKLKTQYGHIFIYDKERMLIELFRLRNKFSRDYFLELIKAYRELKEENAISAYKLSEYAKYFKNGTKLLKTIQEVI